MKQNKKHSRNNRQQQRKAARAKRDWATRQNESERLGGHEAPQAGRDAQVASSCASTRRRVTRTLTGALFDATFTPASNARRNIAEFWRERATRDKRQQTQENKCFT